MFKKIKEILITPNIQDKFRIPLSAKFQFAIGNVGFVLSTGLFAAWLLNFYIKIVKIDPLLWGLAWLLYIAWNAINDPLIGYLGDRTRTRYGRRMPWLMISTPLISISFVLLFFPPMLDPTQASSQWVLFVWLFISLLLYDTFYTIIGISQAALVAELSIMPEERANASFFWAIGGLVGQVVTFILPFLLIVNEEPYSQNLQIMQTLVIIFAIIGSLALAVMSFGIKERKEFSYSETKMMGFYESIKHTIKNKAFLVYTAYIFMLVYINYAIYSHVSFFVQDVLQISGTDILSFLPIVVFVGASLLGFPLAMLFNQKFGGKKAIIYLSILTIAGLILLTFSFDFVTSNVYLFVIGFGYSGVNLLSPILMADVIDKDELETGHRREGAYFGTSALFTKPAQSFAAFLAGVVFILTGYDQSSISQSPLAQFGIKLNIALIPAIFLLVGILILSIFPIDASKHEYKEMKQRLEKVHDLKLQKLKDKND